MGEKTKIKRKEGRNSIKKENKRINEYRIKRENEKKIRYECSPGYYVTPS